ncbi:hypothetical protein SprV_0301005300 [Sparganum proliferum]
MFSAMLMDAYRDERPGIRIAYWAVGHLPNQWRMYFQSRVSTNTVHDLLFADDCALNSTTEDMQRSMDLLVTACENFGEDGGHAPTAAQHCPQCATDQRERNSTASGGQLRVSGRHPLPQQQHRRRKGLPDFQGQSSLRPPSVHSLESSRSSTQHKTEDVEGCHPTNFAVWSRDLNSVNETGTQIQPLPPQLSSPNTEAEMVGPDPRH